MIKSYPIDSLAKDLNASWNPIEKRYASLFDDRFKIIDCSIDPNLAKSLWDETHYDILYKIND